MAKQFTKEELILLEICFDMNAGDNYVRDDLFPEWLEKDHNLTNAKTEKIFKSIAKKFKENAKLTKKFIKGKN